MLTIQIGEKGYKVSAEMLENSNSTYFMGLVNTKFKKESEVFIDRDDTHFDLILKLLRNGSDPEAFSSTLNSLTIINKESVRNECKFYGMDDVVSFINTSLLKKPIKTEYATVMFLSGPDGESNKEKRELEQNGYKYIRQEVKGSLYTLFFEKTSE